MPNTIARIGTGILVQYSTVAAFTSPVTVGEVIGVKLPKFGTDAVEATNVNTASFFKEFISGLVTIGEATFKVNYGSEDAAHIAIALTAKTRLKYFWRFVLTTAANASSVTSPYIYGPFQAITTGFEVSEITKDGVTTATIMLQFTGDSVNGFTIPS